MIAQTALLTRRRFTVKEYHKMVAAGILHEDDRVELIEGEIIEMAPIGRRHADGVNRLNSLFVRRFDDVAVILVQNPIHLNDYGEPQPDFALVHRRPDLYAVDHPAPDDIFLVVEVGDTTANLDRRVRAPLYARYGIPELLLWDLEQDTLTLHRDPSPNGYRTVQTLRRGDRFALLAFPDREILVTDILGEA